MNLCIYLGLLCVSRLAVGYEPLYGHEDPSLNIISDENWDMESTDKWGITKATVEEESDAHTGSNSFSIKDRTNTNGGAYVKVPMSKLKYGSCYYYSIFLKQVSNRTDGQMYSRFKLLARFKRDGKNNNVNLGMVPYMVADRDWKQLGGDFCIPPESEGVIESYMMWIRGEPQTSNYLQDSAALTLIKPYSNMESETDATIDEVRKTDVTVQCPSGGTSVEVELVNHDFCFGTAIKEKGFIVNAEKSVKYRDFVYENFNCGVFENGMKWKMMEGVKGKPQFEALDEALEMLFEHNFRMRGHSIDWDIMESNPGWLLAEDKSNYASEVMKRTEYVVSHFKGKIIEWDVCNELNHQRFFEVMTGQLDIVEQQFRKVMEIDPDTKCFFNDYEVIRNGQKTSALPDLARYFKTRGLPVGGMGIQGHLRELPIRPELLRKRLDIVRSTPDLGLPITITEFSVHSQDEQVKAKSLNEAMRIMFANPAVNGFYFWGFGTEFGGFANDMYLFEGIDNTPLPAGQVYLDLMKEWTTSETIGCGESFRGFYGDYEATVMKDGAVVSTNKFKVTKDGNNTFKL